MTSISAISTNHAKIFTGLRDSRLCNKLAKSKARKWTTMPQVLQDVTDMAIDFKRSCGYSLPTFKVQYVSSTNSSSSYRSNKLTTRNMQQPSIQQKKLKCWHCQGEYYKKDCPTMDTGASINEISFNVYSYIQQQVKLLPPNRKVVSAESDSLGPIGKVHLKFKVGKIEFDGVFVILDSLQQDIILGLPWQCN